MSLRANMGHPFNQNLVFWLPGHDGGTVARDITPYEVTTDFSSGAGDGILRDDDIFLPGKMLPGYMPFDFKGAPENDRLAFPSTTFANTSFEGATNCAMTFWVRMNTLSGNQVFIQAGSGTGGQFRAQFRDSPNSLGTSSGGSQEDLTGCVFEVQEWYFVAIRKHGNNLNNVAARMWKLDEATGQLGSVQSDAASTSASLVPTTGLNIGGFTSSQFIDCRIYDFRIYGGGGERWGTRHLRNLMLWSMAGYPGGIYKSHQFTGVVAGSPTPDPEPDAAKYPPTSMGGGAMLDPLGVGEMVTW